MNSIVDNPQPSNLKPQTSDLKPQTSTICALATAPGGAIGIIRVSGPQTFEILSHVFTKDLSQVAPNTIHYGYVVESDAAHHQVPIDEVLVSVFHAPHSYTGEDSVEISCHGSRYILNKVLELLVKNGCRMAKPGEYTMRAYLNGKMDLSQAEAVADLISSTNRATHQMAMSQLRGRISSELSQLRDQLLKLTSLIELELDFSDHEDLEFADRTELLQLTQHISQHIDKLTLSFKTGRAIKYGVPVAIVGKTNVGKSTLLNRLLKDERAIVSDIHGTTRDTIEDSIDINGVNFRFIDTAGIRQTTDTIEKIGIERTFQTIEKAQIVLWLIDETPSATEIQEMADRCKNKRLIVVQNKIDKSENEKNINISPLDSLVIRISAKKGDGIDYLESAIYQAADIPELNENDVIVTNTRHYEALCRAQESLAHVTEGLQLQLSGDLLAEDLKQVLDILAEITGGEITPNEVLGNIFKHFCVGK